jgi:hypothetical protein
MAPFPAKNYSLASTEETLLEIAEANTPAFAQLPS